jgi:hypothetical protein
MPVQVVKKIKVFFIWVAKFLLVTRYVIVQRIFEFIFAQRDSLTRLGIPADCFIVKLRSLKLSRLGLCLI